jgi:tripartite-type tricarboxylate transporter receptor subunit TctC
MRALAIMWSNRLPLLPDVPTITEATRQNYADVAVWHGVLVPRATPKEIVARLHSELSKAVQHPELRPKLVAQGNVMLGGSSDDFVALLKAESARWGKVVKDLDLKPFD